MVNCFIDPIFLAINNKITTKHFSEVIFPRLYDFCSRIDDIENDLKKRIINFNITLDLIFLIMNYNPYRFRSSISCSSWFKKFLSYFLKQHRNSNCAIVANDKCIDLKYMHENENVPSLVIENWNIFLNNCSNCSYTENRNLEFLTLKDLGSKKVEGTPEFFNSCNIDLMDWLNKQDFTTIAPSVPKTNIINGNLKKKGDWSHSKTKQVMIEIEKILNCKYVEWVKPISKTRQINKNLLELESDNQIKIYIKDAYGTQIFIITTTARNITENLFIIDKILEILPNFEKK